MTMAAAALLGTGCQSMLESTNDSHYVDVWVEVPRLPEGKYNRDDYRIVKGRMSWKPSESSTRKYNRSDYKIMTRGRARVFPPFQSQRRERGLFGGSSSSYLWYW